MKILGKKSISSIIEKFLILLLIFGIGALITGLIIGIARGGNLTDNLITSIVLGIIYLSGFPAIVLIVAFISIFNALKNEEIFSMKNAKCLKTAYSASLIMGIMYLINAILIIIEPYVMHSEVSWETCIGKFYALAVAMVFIIFGIGLIVLNKIYEKAIEYKNENELTI